MTTLQQLIKGTLELQTRQPIMLTNIILLPAGQQGYSGGLLRYFEVTWVLAGDKQPQSGKTSRVVVKEAPLLERRVQTLLNQQKQPGIVPALTFDLETEIPLKAEEYRLALASKGLEIPATEFRERYQEAGRYAGFRYLGFCLWAWRTFEPKYAPGWLDLIKVALRGGYGLAKD